MCGKMEGMNHIETLQEELQAVRAAISAGESALTALRTSRAAIRANIAIERTKQRQADIYMRATHVGRPAYSDEYLLGLLQECARHFDKTPSAADLTEYTGNTGLRQTLTKRFGGWCAACEAAGLTPNARPGSGMGEIRYDDSAVRTAYARIRETVGRPPTLRDWHDVRDITEPGEHILRIRYGSWIGFLEAMSADSSEVS